MADISVIIPCYNVASYINRCITSIRNQTLDLSFLQIICVDDASTDDTWQHLQKWESLCPDLITIIHCDTNERQGTARNVGMEYCNTPWVSFIDADDWIEPDYFEKMYAIALQCQCDIVCCDQMRDPSPTLTYTSKKENGQESGLVVINTVEQRKSFIASENLGTSPCGKLIQTNLLTNNSISFPQNITYEDNLWSSLLYFYANSVYFLEEYLYHWFVNQNSTILTRNADYHVDILTTSLMSWKEWYNRGFFNKYKNELELLFLNDCYFIFMRMLVMRHDTPSFSLFQLCRELLLTHIPNFRSNPYADKLTEFHKLLVNLLFQPIQKSEFVELTELAKEYWKYNR